MKKSFGLIALVAFLLVSVVLNVILFLTVDTIFDGRTSEASFWLVWSFTFPLNLIITIAAIFYLMRKSTDIIIHVPVTLIVTAVFFVIYVFVAFKFFFYSITCNMTIAIIAETVITALYIIAIIVSLFALGYIENNQKLTKEKVLTIRLLKSDVDGCIPFVKDPALANQLGKLSEKIRYSDPMSHSSLKSCEDEIAAMIAGIQMKAKMGEEDGIAETIKKIDILLDYRNDRCKILK